MTPPKSMNVDEAMTIESYRGVEYQVNPACFRDFLPGAALRWGYWNRFLTDDEVALLEAGREQREILHRAIDRAHNDNPVYTGDMRERRNSNQESG